LRLAKVLLGCWEANHWLHWVTHRPSVVIYVRAKALLPLLGHTIAAKTLHLATETPAITHLLLRHLIKALP
jgi:hypothetical protein